MREAEAGSEYHVNPATPEDLDWIARLEIDTYSAKYAVAKRTLEEWYCANPDGFSVLMMNGQRIGHLNILPLRPRILKSFVQGTILEKDIDGDSLYTPGEKNLIRNLHVESFIIQSPKEGSTPPIRAGMFLVRNFIPLMRRICDPANIENVYAIAASERGGRLSKGFGFELVKSGRERADQRGLYVAKFSTLKANISELHNRRLKNAKLKM